MSHSSPFSRDHYFFLILTLITILTLLLVRPFLGALLTSLVLAMLLHPFCKFIQKVTHLSNAVSTLITLVVALIVVLIPFVSLVTTLASQTYILQQNLSKNYDRQTIEALSDQANLYLETIPFVSYEVDAQAVMQASQSIAKTIGNWFFTSAVSLTSSTVTFITNLLIVIVTTVSLLPNLDRIKRYIVRLSPLDKDMTQRYLKTGQVMMSNMLKGAFFIAFLQASLAGLLLWYLQVPLTLLLTLVMMVLAIIPYMGTAFVMLPIALIFLVSGQSSIALIIALHQILIVSSIDNLLRPLLTSSQAKLHPAIMLLSILGGIKLFGPFLGLIYGPIITILFLTTLDIYQESHQ